MGRINDPLSVWTQVPLATKKASVIKSLQNVAVSATVAGNASGANVDTTITSVDTAKSIIIVRHRDYVPSGSNIGGTISWTLSSDTNFRIAGVNNSGASDTTLTFNVTILEYY
jgi:ABC-type molybdenum transport system ATPase subunit/photorepair protein PhrA